MLKGLVKSRRVTTKVMSINKKRTLLVNTNGAPYSITTGKRGVLLMFEHQEMPEKGAVPLEYYADQVIYSAGGVAYPIPCVSMLPRFMNPPKKVAFSRKNVFLRDDLCCCYCGKQFFPHELTYDHVIPRAKWDKKLGTPTNWNNIVTACRFCNTYKGDKILEKSGLRLLKKPFEPKPGPRYISGLNLFSGKLSEQWIPYFAGSLDKILNKVYSSK